MIEIYRRRTTLGAAAATMLGAVLFSGCGFDGPFDTPSPPPQPPAQLSQHDADVITHTGGVADVSPATRTWTQSGDGQRLVAHLGDHGILTVNGQATQVEDLVAGMIVTSEGKQVGDLLLVERADAKDALVDVDIAGGAVAVPAAVGGSAADPAVAPPVAPAVAPPVAPAVAPPPTTP